MWVWGNHSVFCFVCFASYFSWRNSTRSHNTEVLHFHLLKFHFLHWSFEKEEKNVRCLLYSPQLFVDLRLHQAFSMVLCWLLLRNHPLLLKFLNTSLSRNLFKNFEDPSQIPPVRALISFYLLWYRHFQAMVGSQLSTSLGFVSGIWVIHLGKFQTSFSHKSSVFKVTFYDISEGNQKPEIVQSSLRAILCPSIVGSCFASPVH